MIEEAKNKRGGRPRNEDTTAAILSAALDLMEEVGLKAVTMEGIAVRAGVTKTTVFRRWPSTWAIVLDAFLQEIVPTLEFEPQINLRETVRADMKALAASFRGRPGRVFAPLLGVAQFNLELREALWERYIGPRRAQARAVFNAQKYGGELRPELDGDAVLDALYGSLVYKLLVPHGELSDEYVDALVECVFGGVAPRSGFDGNF